MFESLKEWMTCPIIIKPFKGLNSYADKEFGDPITILGYFAGEAMVVNNESNTQVVSNTQIYYDPSKYTVDIQDRVIVDGREKDIVSISNFMDGNTGSSSIKVIYL